MTSKQEYATRARWVEKMPWMLVRVSASCTFARHVHEKSVRMIKAARLESDFSSLEKRSRVRRSAPKARHSCSPCAAEPWEPLSDLIGSRRAAFEDAFSARRHSSRTKNVAPAGSIFFDLTTHGSSAHGLQE